MRRRCAFIHCLGREGHFVQRVYVIGWEGRRARVQRARWTVYRPSGYRLSPGEVMLVPGDSVELAPGWSFGTLKTERARRQWAALRAGCEP